MGGRLPRDGRVDAFRAWALLMMFINHVPGTIYTSYTTGKLGFSDAEAFVLVSGIAAGLAYSAPFTGGGQPMATVLRMLARARTIYLAHIVTSVIGLGIFAGAALWFGAYRLLGTNNLELLFAHPLEAMIGLPLLTYQVGYFDILPLYFVLTLVTPVMLLIWTRSPFVLLLLSITLWAAAGRFHLDLPTYPARYGWFFDPLSWQLIYVVGLLAGAAMRQGEKLVAFSAPLFWLAIGFLVLAFAWTHTTEVRGLGDAWFRWLRGMGATYEQASLDKHRLAPLRLLHALALAYVLASIPQVKALCNSRWAAPLRLLGRHGLAVFAAQSVLCVLLQAVRVKVRGGPLVDAVMLIGGMLLMLLLAAALDWANRVKARQHLPSGTARGRVLDGRLAPGVG